MKKKILIMLLSIIVSLASGCRAVESNLQTIHTELGIKQTEESSTIKNLAWIWNAVEHLNVQTLDDALEIGVNMISINGGYEPSYDKDNIYLRGKSQDYETFIRRANESNIEVNVLFGTPEWAKLEHSDYMMIHIEEVLKYNETHKNARFSSIHLDIEPHGLLEWDSLSSLEKNSIIKSTITNIKEVKNAIENHNNKNEDNLQLLIDIAPAVSEYDAYIDDLFSVCDTIVLMNYTKESDKYETWPINYLEAGSKLDKKVIIGSEFQDKTKFKDKSEYEKVSLDSMTGREVAELLDKGLKIFKEYDSFSGLAFHDFYDYYKHKVIRE